MFISRLSPKKREHIRGLFRVGVYVTVITGASSLLSVRAARAEFEDRSVLIGRQMVELAQSTEQDTHRLTLNGQAMWVGSSQSDDPASNILDRYQSYCEKNSAQPTNAWRELADKADATVDKSFLSTGVLRGGNDREGAVICFTKSAESKTSIQDAVKAFAETGQLGALGAVRYAYVKQSPSGKSVVVTAWTDDKFNIFDLIPKENEDAPGVDFADIPRPTASNRVLSTRLEGTYFGVNVYRGFGSPKSVAAFYDEEMERRGWEVFDVTSDLEAKEAAEANHLPPPVEPEGKATGRLYAKGGVVLTLSSGIEEGATFSALGLAGATEKEMQSPWHR